MGSETAGDVHDNALQSSSDDESTKVVLDYKAKEALHRKQVSPSLLENTAQTKGLMLQWLAKKLRAQFGAYQEPGPRPATNADLKAAAGFVGFGAVSPLLASLGAALIATSLAFPLFVAAVVVGVGSLVTVVENRAKQRRQREDRCDPSGKYAGGGVARDGQSGSTPSSFAQRGLDQGDLKQSVGAFLGLGVGPSLVSVAATFMTAGIAAPIGIALMAAGGVATLVGGGGFLSGLCDNREHRGDGGLTSGDRWQLLGTGAAVVVGPLLAGVGITALVTGLGLVMCMAFAAVGAVITLGGFGALGYGITKNESKELSKQREMLAAAPSVPRPERARELVNEKQAGREIFPTAVPAQEHHTQAQVVVPGPREVSGISCAEVG